MGFMKCPDCGTVVSSDVKNCPKCSCPSEYFTECDPPENKQPEEDSTSQNNNIEKKEEFELPDSLRPDGGKKPIPKKKTFEDIKNKLKISIMNTKDCESLMEANDAFLRLLKKDLSSDLGINYVDSSSIEKYYAEIDENAPNYPYAMVYADAMFSSQYGHYYYKTKDRESIKQYYNGSYWPIDYGPVLTVYSDNEAQLKKIASEIREKYYRKWRSIKVDVLKDAFKKVEATLLVDFFGDPYCEVDTGEASLWKFVVGFKEKPFVLRMDEKTLKIGHKPKEDLRQLQMALYYDQLLKTKIACEGDIKLYRMLLEDCYAPQSAPQDGLFGLANDIFKGAKQALAPKQNDGYKKLKETLLAGGTFNADLVEEAFPNLSVIYHGLPNDVAQRNNPDAIKRMLDGFMTSIQSEKNRILNEKGIPKNLDGYAQGFEHNLQTTKGIEYIIDQLDKFPDKTIFDVVTEYKEKRNAVIKEREEAEKNRLTQRDFEAMGFHAEYDDYEPDYYDRPRSSGHGLLTTAMHAAAGAAVGSYAGSRGVERELRKQTDIMRREEKERQRDRERAKREADMQRIHDSIERGKEASRANYERDQIIKANRERRRKGLPELPVPPWRSI